MNVSLGSRMKEYENVSRNYLTRRTPVIIRIDGKAFHTFTKGFKKPFDDIMVRSMQDTMKYLCENIQGCVLGYTQSDEITLVLVDYKNIDTSAWFDNNMQKMVSISASMSTFAFNTNYREYTESYLNRLSTTEVVKTYKNYFDKNGNFKQALFDSRVFNIPKEEVCNCLIWRQQDATRNSIQSVGQANFSSKQLHGKSCNEIQDMLMLQKGINWNDYPTHLKRGSCCIKKSVVKGDVERSVWEIDTEIPIFTQNRDYVDNLIFI